MNISFIGLGTMGYHMAGHLSKSNHNISVYNRSSDKSAKWGQKFSGNVCEKLSNAVNHQQIIILCLGRDEDVLSVIENPEFMNNLMDNSIVIDHTTTSYDLAKNLQNKFKAKNVKFIDAPVSGGEAGAVNGILSTMVGGKAEDIDFATPVLENYCKSITHIGDTGYGQLAKMTNQICIAGVLQGLSEAIKFAESENIDLSKLIPAISGGAAQSWQMVNRGETMGKREFDFGFALKWMVKDLGYCIDRAKINKTDLSLTTSVNESYKNLATLGKENMDTSALILSYDK